MAFCTKGAVSLMSPLADMNIEMRLNRLPLPPLTPSPVTGIFTLECGGFLALPSQSLFKSLLRVRLRDMAILNAKSSWDHSNAPDIQSDTKLFRGAGAMGGAFTAQRKSSPSTRRLAKNNGERATRWEPAASSPHRALNCATRLCQLWTVAMAIVVTSHWPSSRRPYRLTI
jgi:hypothetical protein